MGRDRKDWGPNTRGVRAGLHRSPHKETSEALYLTSGFVYDSAEEADARFEGTAPGYLYGRYANPTNTMLIERLCALEGAEDGRLAASGMAAVTAAMLAPLKAGDHVVAGEALFGSCRWVLETLMPRFGMSCTLVPTPDLDAWRAAIRPETKSLFLESPANPTLEIADVRAIAQIAHEADARLIVDNIFASPVVQQPLALGADVVVYSTTKHMDGQGRTLGGAILGSKAFMDEHIEPFLRHTGPSMSPFNAWVALKGLETLRLRVERQCRTAAVLADMISAHPAVSRCVYPGRADHPQHDIARSQMSSGGSLIAFELAGGRTAAFAFLNALQIVDISNNLGDAKSLATHPATTTHRTLEPAAQLRIGVTPGVIRLSVGLEDEEDLIDDVAGALATAGGA